MPGTVWSTRNSKKNKIKFLLKGPHGLVGSKDADGNMFGKPATSQLIYSGGPEIPYGKSEASRITEIRQKRQQGSFEA